MRYPGKTWDEIMSWANKSIKDCETRINTDNSKSYRNDYQALYDGYRTVAIDHLLKNEIAQFKNIAFNAATIAMYNYKEFNNIWYNVNYYPFGLALISDNLNIVETYTNTNYRSENRYIKVSYLLKVQIALVKEEEEEIVNTVKRIDHNISIKKNINLNKANKLCITGIVENDIQKIYEGVKIFEKATQKNSLERNQQCESVFSMFPTIYLKIAKMKGLNVSFNSERIFEDAIKIEPIPEYKLRVKLNKSNDLQQ